MDLNTLWFILIGILFVGYFILEGFDLGVGIWLPFLGKNDTHRRMIINTIGPHWDGNEVWLITAGGAMFAAFPGWYATLFSSFYLPLLIMLLALIVRGVALEFRSKHDSLRWRSFWDWAICMGSFLPALLWGVAFANFVRGIPIDATKNFVGSFGDLINIYSLLGGLVAGGWLLAVGVIILVLTLVLYFTIGKADISMPLYGTPTPSIDLSPTFYQMNILDAILTNNATYGSVIFQ